jgi:cytochrome c-type biogenesis protein CcmH/NrfF
MPLREVMNADAVAMMRRVLLAECARRSIEPDSPMGEDLALVVLAAYRSGMSEERISQILRARYG